MKQLLIGFGVALFFMGLAGCTGDKKNESDDTEIVKPDSIPDFPTAGSVSGDTMNLHGKFVVFYASEDTSIASSVETFKETIAIITDSLKKTADIPFAITSVHNFRVYSRTGSTMIISRQGFPEKFGVLLMDGLQPPTIRKGDITTEECHAMIKKYFMRP